ncbi:hypothetical protein [Nocardia wallacei]|uniref:hypothetical protein n=1 Tax=Nocardia wallacei TaxID=480035 RepID=UPI002458C7AA|nr:hypothetical protein [Nocardia wallacei]
MIAFEVVSAAVWLKIEANGEGGLRLADLETLIAQVWNPEVRSLAEEAWRCYNAGAIRACIATTWAAITADIITKLVQLADAGDQQAVDFRDGLDSARQKGLTQDGVRAMQQIENGLLGTAVRFELIDTIGERELTRIREDRNLSVHPSLRTLDDVYQPRPEVARGHLAVALTNLLIHPPVQGRKVVEEFATYVCDPYFVASTPHIQAAFYDRVRAAARTNLVKFAAKHALLELDPAGRMSAIDHADRMAVALDAFAQRDRELVRAVMSKFTDRFQTLDGATQLRALIRLGAHDYFWDVLDQPLVTRLENMIYARIPDSEWDQLPGDVAAAMALARSPFVRQQLPELEVRLSALQPMHRMSVLTSADPDPYFVSAVLQSLRDAWSYRAAEQVGRLLVQYARFLNNGELRAALSAWSGNAQCRQAIDMLGLAVQLFHGTGQLGDSRGALFREFLEAVRAEEDETSYYTYADLEQGLQAAGL